MACYQSSDEANRLNRERQKEKQKRPKSVWECRTNEYYPSFMYIKLCHSKALGREKQWAA
jgi:hypothetical protein